MHSERRLTEIRPVNGACFDQLTQRTTTAKLIDRHATRNERPSKIPSPDGGELAINLECHDMERHVCMGTLAPANSSPIRIVNDKGKAGAHVTTRGRLTPAGDAINQKLRRKVDGRFEWQKTIEGAGRNRR